MVVQLSEIREYLISTGEYTEDEVAEMSVEEAVDLYEMYHEE